MKKWYNFIIFVFILQLGRQQLFNVGRNLNNRYNSLFNGRYKQEDIYVKSTLTPRTYMSVAILLAGMFPPSGDEIWNPELIWQPIPIWPDEFDKTEVRRFPFYFYLIFLG